MKSSSYSNVSAEKTDRFLLFMTSFWHLQRKFLFNNDSNYLITKFMQISTLYGKFLTEFFNIIFNENMEVKQEGSMLTGDILPQFNKSMLSNNFGIEWDGFCQETFDNYMFFKKNFKLGNSTITTNSQSFINSLPEDLPLFNMFIIQEKMYGAIDDYLIGALFENILSEKTKKSTGAYYTPKNICDSISESSLYNFFFSNLYENDYFNNIHDKINSPNTLIKDLQGYFENLDTQKKEKNILKIANLLKNIRILDPSVGSGHFLASIIDFLISIYHFLWKLIRKYKFKNLLILKIIKNNSIKEIDLSKIDDFDELTIYLKYFWIYSSSIYGLDINPYAVIISKIRLFLNFIQSWKSSKIFPYPLKNLIINIKMGNSLIGYRSWNELKSNSFQKQLNLNNKIQIFESKELIDQLNGLTSSNLKDLRTQFENSFNFPTNYIENQISIIEKKEKSKTQIQTIEQYAEILYYLKILSQISIIDKNFYEISSIYKILSKITVDKCNELHEVHYNLRKKKIKLYQFHWIVEFPENFNSKLRFDLNNHTKSINTNGFDIVLGNPPYGNLLNSNEKSIIKFKHSFRNEISSVFIEMCIKLNRNKGILDFITTYAICFSKDLSKTRKYIVDNYRLCKISTFDRDKCRFFEGMTQSVSILQCISKKSPKASDLIESPNQTPVYTSVMYRKMPKLNEISYYKTNEFLLGNMIGTSFSTKHRLPKIGNRKIAEFLQILKDSYQKNQNSEFKCIGDIISTSTIIKNQEEWNKHLKKSKDHQNFLWIRISGNYWYNAWDRPPYFGTQIAFCKVVPSIPNLRSFLIILINSSFYYNWFRIYSDGRHMNADIMKSLPLPNDFLKKVYKNAKIIKILSDLLINLLFLHFDKKHNRFQTSQIKSFIDICDLLIGKLYNLTPDQINNIQNFEPSVRGGKKISEKVESQISSLVDQLSDSKIIQDKIYELKKELIKLIEK